MLKRRTSCKSVLFTPHSNRRSRMTGTITDVVKQFKNDWTSLLEPAAVRSAIAGGNDYWIRW